MYLGFILVLKSRPRNITYKSLCVCGGGGRRSGKGRGNIVVKLLSGSVCVCVCCMGIHALCGG